MVWWIIGVIAWLGIGYLVGGVIKKVTTKHDMPWAEWMRIAYTLSGPLTLIVLFAWFLAYYA